jgi:hypothetical protein
MRHNETASGAMTDQGDFGWLVAKLRELSRRAGYTQEADETYLRSSLPYLIARTRDQIRVEQSLRTVIIAPPDDPPIGELSVSAAAEGSGRPNEPRPATS